MSDATATSYVPVRQNPLRRAEAWLDARGKGAWIAATVLGFILFWPIGLALLGYMLFIKQNIGSGSCAGRGMMRTRMASSGNAAFDAYRDQTIQRLENEQARFEAFLKRLRDAKDQAEFDAFMAEREVERSRKADSRRDDGDDHDAAA